MSPEDAFRRVLAARLPAGPGWTAWIDGTVTELAAQRRHDAAIKEFPLIEGRCPSCGRESLFRGAGGWVTCSNAACLDPSAASDLLAGTPGVVLSPAETELAAEALRMIDGAFAFEQRDIRANLAARLEGAS